jgi:hypothetical protein
LIVWKRPGDYGFSVHEKTGRIFLHNSGDVDVVRLRDGRSLAKFSVKGPRAPAIRTEGDWVVLDPQGEGSELFDLVGWFDRGEEPIHVIDANSRIRSIAGNVATISLVVGDVLLSRNEGSSGVNQAIAALDAYSLSNFGPPQNELAPYEQVIALLERYPRSRKVKEAMNALRAIPDAMASLERVIETAPPSLKAPAIALAAYNGHTRFVAPECSKP